MISFTCRECAEPIADVTATCPYCGYVPPQSPEMQRLAKAKRPRNPPSFWRGGMIALAIVTSVIGICSLFPAMMSIMLFDNPKSGANPKIWVLFFSISTLPVASLVSVVKASRLASSRARLRALDAFWVGWPYVNLAAAYITLQLDW